MVKFEPEVGVGISSTLEIVEESDATLSSLSEDDVVSEIIRLIVRVLYLCPLVDL